MPLTGLTSAEVAPRVERGEVNRAPRSAWLDYAKIVARNLFTLFNALVVPVAIGLFLAKDYNPAFAVSGMAVINTVLGLVQEIRAKRHLDKLAVLAATHARVLRDGQVRDILADDVVRDDVVLVASGEPIVADGPVLEAHYLEVDEALLTGESDPVPRKVGESLLSGSFCVAGDGAYRAEKVGGQSFAHLTSAQARAYSYSTSPLQHSINLLIWVLSGVAVALCLAYVVLYFLRGVPWDDFLLMVAATVTSMVPQGLVLMTTLAFTLAAVRMAKKGAVVQRLSAVESMAAVNVLCLDKTGTLTTNNLELERLVPVADAPEADVRALLRLFASALVDTKNKNILALRAALDECPVELVDQLPFKSQNRYSAVRIKEGKTERILVLGAGEALRPLLTDGKWEPAWRELLPTGLRVLLFAESIELKPFDGSLAGFALRPLCLVALSDELRHDAGEVLEALAAQNIAFKIISGDNPETVRATVAHLKLPLAREPVVSGDELEQAPNRVELILSRSVFGRVAPRQKLEIVKTLEDAGRYVAMLGDGVNDVLPIKQAHLGIAMGEGSQAARTVAGLVLETNNFALLPETLEEGRTILRNLRRAGKLFLLKNVYTLLLIVFALGIFRLPFPYLPQQVTLLNLLTIGIPAFVFTLSRERAGPPSGHGFLREVGSFALRTGIVTGGLGLGLFAFSAWRGDDVRLQRTLLLTMLIMLGLTSVLRVLADGESAALDGDRKYRWLVVTAVPVFLAVLYTPLSADFFELTPLGFLNWLLVLAVTTVGFAACKATDVWARS
jgi:cation-transporting ATPase E